MHFMENSWRFWQRAGQFMFGKISLASSLLIHFTLAY